MSSIKMLALPAAALLLLTAAGPGQTQSPGPVLMRSADRALTAHAIGPRCDTRVQVSVSGRDVSFFQGAAPQVLTLIQGLRSALSLECPQMQRLVVRGSVTGAPIYSAIAEAAQRWNILVMPASHLDAAAAAPLQQGYAGPTARDMLKRSGRFVPATEILRQSATPVICYAPSANGEVCESAVRFTNISATSANAVLRSPLEAKGAEAVVTSRAVIRDGLLCNNNTDVRIEVRGGTLSAEARQELAGLFRERFESAGEVCSGFSTRAGGDLQATAFNARGEQLQQPTEIRAMARDPQLRPRA
ncbi:hypothetical protein [Brevundimonas diminuta]|uniref:hypothetical protein n=1 Tax=Brevundimonas diminuta TaxID=293 RepID=UPI003D084BFF